MKVSFILFLLISVFSCQSNVREQQSQEAYQRGIDALQQADSEQKAATARALAHFSTAVTLSPTHTEAALWKSQLELKLGKYEDALQTANAAIQRLTEENHRLLPNFYILAGIAEILNGNQHLGQIQLQKASAIYAQRIEIDENNIDAISNKAIVLCYMGKNEEASAFLNSLTVSKENRQLVEQMKEDITACELGEILKAFVSVE